MRCEFVIGGEGGGGNRHCGNCRWAPSVPVVVEVDAIRQLRVALELLDLHLENGKMLQDGVLDGSHVLSPDPVLLRRADKALRRALVLFPRLVAPKRAVHSTELYEHAGIVALHPVLLVQALPVELVDGSRRKPLVVLLQDLVQRGVWCAWEMGHREQSSPGDA